MEPNVTVKDEVEGREVEFTLVRDKTLVVTVSMFPGTGIAAWIKPQNVAPLRDFLNHFYPEKPAHERTAPMAFKTETAMQLSLLLALAAAAKFSVPHQQEDSRRGDEAREIISLIDETLEDMKPAILGVNAQ